jgi:hypothetical protein
MNESAEKPSIWFKIKKFLRMDTGPVKINISSSGVPSVTCAEYLRQPRVQAAMESLKNVKIS